MTRDVDSAPWSTEEIMRCLSDPALHDVVAIVILLEDVELPASVTVQLKAIGNEDRARELAAKICWLGNVLAGKPPPPWPWTKRESKNCQPHWGEPRWVDFNPEAGIRAEGAEERVETFADWCARLHRCLVNPETGAERRVLCANVLADVAEEWPRPDEPSARGPTSGTFFMLVIANEYEFSTRG